MMELPEDDWCRSILMCIEYFSKRVVLVSLEEFDTQAIASHFQEEVMSY